MKHETRLDEKLEREIKQLLANGQKIEAIRLVLESLKIGLKNSKDLVDRIEESQQI